MFDRYHLKPAFLNIAAIVLSGVLTSSALAQEPDPRVLLDRMSAEVAGLEEFIISGDAYADARLPAGQIIEHASEVTMQVRKPDAMRMTKLDSEGSKELYVGSGMLTFYSETEGFYARTAVPEGVEEAVDFAVDEVGIDAPLLDFVSSNLAERLQEDATQVEHVGTSLIRGNLYDHVTIRGAEVDIQVWIAAEGRPLPGKISMSSKWEGGSPRFVVFMDWNTDPEFPDTDFSFTPPKGATEIQFDSSY